MRPRRIAILAAALIAALIPLLLWISWEAALDRPLKAPDRTASRAPAAQSEPPAEASARELRARAFRVRPGEGFRMISARLHSEGWIGSVWAARIEARRRGWDRRIAPGWYGVRPGDTVRSFLARLGRSELEQARITVPEGWRLSRILTVLSDSAWVPPDSLQAAARDEAWQREEQVPGPGLEGYLLPDTYLVPRGEEPHRLLGQLLRGGRELWRDSLQAPALKLGLDRRRLWTLASLIEAEAAFPAERARISAVFWNRLRCGMRLECDPTVLFALNRPPGRVLFDDLAVESPYNTYRYTGLPPGPICSPGRASLQAALAPLPGCTDLFFVARGDGTHVFSRSLEEHNRARAAVKRDATRRTASSALRVRS